MTIDGIRLLELLPEFLRGDVTAQAYAAALDGLLSYAGAGSARIDLSALDELPERVLDSLAWQNMITWYDYRASIEVKRALIRNAGAVHALRGTPRAVQQVMSDMLGSTARLTEWYDYGGEPYHFRAVSGGEIIGAQERARLLAAIDEVKNVRSVMDEIIWAFVGEGTGYIAAGAQLALRLEGEGEVI